MYAISHSNNTAYVINVNETGKISKEPFEILLGNNPDQLAIDRNQNKIYVSNPSSNTVTVINGSDDNNKTTTITQMDRNPRGIAVDPDTHMVYVANMLSGTVSFINGTAEEVKSIIDFRTNPVAGGDIYCREGSHDYFKVSNTLKFYNNDSIILCRSQPNTGFAFSSWSGDVNLENVRRIPTNETEDLPLDRSLIELWYDDLSANNADLTERSITFNTTKSGTVNANFVTSAPIPKEFWTPIYGIIPTVITATLIPSIILWNKERRQSKRLRDSYSKQIESLRNLEDQDTLKKDIRNSYNEGRLKDSDYQELSQKLKKYLGTGSMS